MLEFENKYTKWILLTFILLGIIMRYIFCSINSLSAEEQIFWSISSQDSLATVFSLVKENIKSHNFIAFLLDFANYKIYDYFGIYSEYIVRLPAMLAGILSIPLSFILVRKLYSEAEALFVAVFFSFSWIHIQSWQAFNGWSIFLCLTILFFIALINFFNTLSTNKVIWSADIFFLIASAILLILSNIFGVILVFVGFCYSFFFVKQIKLFLRTAAYFFAIFILSALYYYFLFSNNFLSFSDKFSILDFFLSLNYLLSNNLLITGLLVLPLLFLIFVYIKKVFKRGKFGEDARTSFINSTLFLVIWLFGASGLFLLSIYFLHIKYVETDILFLLLPIIILGARGIVLLPKILKFQYIYLVVFSLIILINSYILQGSASMKNPDYDKAIRYVLRKSEQYNRNIVVLTGLDKYSFPKSTFYLKKYDIKYNIFLLNSYNLELPFRNTYCWCFLDEQITKDLVKENILRKFNVIDGLQYNNLTLLLIKT